jgi:hypothetical protein
MATLKLKLTEAPKTPERGVRAATFRLLLDTAMDIIREAGHIPSVAEVAARGCRAPPRTATFEPQRADHRGDRPLARAGAQLQVKRPTAASACAEVFVQTFPRFKEFEPQMRAALQLALEHWALERPACWRKKPIAAATACASSSTPSRRWRRRCRRRALRLHRALSVIFGIEPWVVLKDIGASPIARSNASRCGWPTR